jgi:ABC-type cobalamin/Fe3+-siderophores transport system ATPase subunit
MKILGLNVENYMRVVAVNLKPDGKTLVVSGPNGAGKSSVLDSIVTALGGKNAAADEPVRRGERSARVEVETDELVVTRKWLGDNTYLEVKTKGDPPAKISRPQEYLNKLIGDLSFDPLAFKDKNPAEQRDEVMRMLGMSTQDLDEKIVTLKQHRSMVRINKQGMTLDLDRMPSYSDAPNELLDPAKIIEEIQAAMDHNMLVSSAAAVRQQKLDAIEAWNEQIPILEEQLSSLQQRRSEVLEELRDESEVEIINTDEIRDRLAEVEASNDLTRKKQARRKLEDDIMEAGEKYTELGREIDILHAQKDRRLREAQMPINGLGFGEGCLTFEGVPLKQVNTAKQTEVCVALAMKLNPTLKVVRINGNDLDDNTLDTIIKACEGQDYQAFIERIYSPEGVGVRIEEGRVAD